MKPVRIVSYNVRYFGHAMKGVASTRSAMHRIAGALASLAPVADVVCLQEVETVSLRATAAHPVAAGEAPATQLERFTELLDAALEARGVADRYDAFYFPAHDYRVRTLSLYTTGLAVLVNRRCAVEGHNADAPHDITHREIHPVRGLKQTRICAHLRVTPPDGPMFDVFNTHLSLPTTRTLAFWTRRRRMGFGPNQVEEARALAAFVRAERSSDRFVLVGDFNSLPGSKVYRELLRQGDCIDAFAAHHALDERTLEELPTAGFLALRMRIDHLFSGRGLAWTEFDSTHAFSSERAPFEGMSDHAPLIGSFVLP